MADTSTQTQNSNINPSWDAKASLFGLGLITSGIVDQTFAIDHSLTLNNQLNFQPNVEPTGARKIRYFCYGNGGRQNVSNNLTEAYRVSGLDGMPYGILPVRMVPIEEDLSAADMALVGGRTITTIARNGTSQAYATYYLAALEKKADQVTFVRNDTQTKTMVAYTPTIDCMSPKPLVADNNGVLTDPADSISTAAPFGLTVLGANVLEVCNILFNGDTRYANISEFGLIAADVQTVNEKDYQNKPFTYQEAIAAQMVTHSTTAGTQITGPDTNIVKTVNIGLQNISVVLK